MTGDIKSRKQGVPRFQLGLLCERLDKRGLAAVGVPDHRHRWHSGLLPTLPQLLPLRSQVCNLLLQSGFQLLEHKAMFLKVLLAQVAPTGLSISLHLILDSQPGKGNDGIQDA